MNVTKAHFFGRLEIEFGGIFTLHFRLETYHTQLVEMVAFRSLNIQPS